MYLLVIVAMHAVRSKPSVRLRHVIGSKPSVRLRHVIRSKPSIWLWHIVWFVHIIKVLHRRPMAHRVMPQVLARPACALHYDKSRHQDSDEREIKPAPLPLYEQRRQQEIMNEKHDKDKSKLLPHVYHVMPPEHQIAVLVGTHIVTHDRSHEQYAPQQSVYSQLLPVLLPHLHGFLLTSSAALFWFCLPGARWQCPEHDLCDVR